MKRRAFLGGTLSAAAYGTCEAPSVAAAAQNAMIRMPPEPLVWPLATALQPGIRSFVGHADTVLDVIGRIGAPPSLVIFTEGNHLMVLSSDDIVRAFGSWTKSQPQYADLDVSNVILVTLPQPIIVRAIPENERAAVPRFRPARVPHSRGELGMQSHVARADYRFAGIFSHRPAQHGRATSPDRGSD